MESAPRQSNRLFFALCVGSAALCGTLSAQVTERVSVSSYAAQGNLDSTWASVSADGSYVVFASSASTLVSHDTNLREDVFLRDRVNGRTARLSVSSAGVQANGPSTRPVISPDGRYVVFESDATNLGFADINGANTDIFLVDRTSGILERVSVYTSGAQAEDFSHAPALSPDGRFVAFTCHDSFLAAGDTNGANDVYLRDRLLGTTECISIDASGIPGNSASNAPSLSADGRFVAFHSDASNLVSGDTNGVRDVFLRDRLLGTTERVSVSLGGLQGNGDSILPAITPDARFIAFSSTASTLTPDDTNNHADVFVQDRLLGTLDLASLTWTGGQATESSANPSISGDGQFVAWNSIAQDFVEIDNNGCNDVFLRDRALGTTVRVSVASDGSQAQGQSYSPSFSADGRFIAFNGTATNLAPGDTNGRYDVFLRDRAATGFSSECDAGTGGVASCPCNNPPNQLGKGCDNSFGTGGATLLASGAAYLSADSLRFTTSGEGADVLSILMQGNGAIPGGVTFGHGVRCLGGSRIERLYIKRASAGSMLAPDPASGDATVSAQSAARGDVIRAGESRWYLVYYHDPAVLGACTDSGRFNATQTGRVTWSF